MLEAPDQRGRSQAPSVLPPESTFESPFTPFMITKEEEGSSSVSDDSAQEDIQSADISHKLNDVFLSFLIQYACLALDQPVSTQLKITRLGSLKMRLSCMFLPTPNTSVKEA